MNTETKPLERVAGIPLSDLEIVSRVVVLRLDNTCQEDARRRHIDQVLSSAHELIGALALYRRHALVDRTGTPGTADLFADTRGVQRALIQYARVVHLVAAEYEPVLRPTRYTTDSDAAGCGRDDIAEAV